MGTEQENHYQCTMIQVLPLDNDDADTRFCSNR